MSLINLSLARKNNMYSLVIAVRAKRGHAVEPMGKGKPENGGACHASERTFGKFCCPCITVVHSLVAQVQVIFSQLFSYHCAHVALCIHVTSTFLFALVVHFCFVCWTLPCFAYLLIGMLELFTAFVCDACSDANLENLFLARLRFALYVHIHNTPLDIEYSLASHYRHAQLAPRWHSHCHLFRPAIDSQSAWQCAGDCSATWRGNLFCIFKPTRHFDPNFISWMEAGKRYY